MNYQEIIDELQKQEIEITTFAYGDMDNPLPNIGAWEKVEQIGGEDEGTDWHSVKYFPDHDIYIKIEGYYTSYSGTEFDDGWGCCSEVKPIQKTITVYE